MRRELLETRFFLNSCLRFICEQRKTRLMLAGLLSIKFAILVKKLMWVKNEFLGYT